MIKTVKITPYGAVLNTPYGQLKLSFGRSHRIEIPEEDVQTTVPRKKFVELTEKIRSGKLSQEKLDLLKRISKLSGGWEQSEKVRTLLKVDAENQLESLRKEVNSMIEERKEEQRKKREFRQAWEDVREKGFYVRNYRGSKPRYLIVCSGYGRFYLIQLPPEYEFRFYRGKSSKPVTLGRRLKKRPSKLISNYSRNHEEEVIQDFRDDKKALENLGNALDELPEPQKSELEKRLVALKLTGEKK